MQQYVGMIKFNKKADDHQESRKCSGRTCKQNDNELKVLLGLPTPYFVREYREAARNYGGKKLISIFEALKTADLKSKGVGARGMENREILRDLMIEVLYN